MSDKDIEIIRNFVKKGGKLFGQMSYAQEALPQNGDECTAHGYVALDYGDKTLADFIKGEWETKDLYPIGMLGERHSRDKKGDRDRRGQQGY